MQKGKSFIFISLLLVIAACGHSAERFQDTIVTIKIKAESFKNQTFKSYFPKAIIKLNSNGEGTLTIPLKKYFFVDFAINDSLEFTLLLYPGDDLVFHANKGKWSFIGEGAIPNNYLLKSEILINQFAISVRKNRNDFLKFIAFCDSFELAYTYFHKKYSDSIPFTKEIDYLLKNYAYSTILFEKEMYLLKLDKKEIVSLNLIKKLGLLNNVICKDTLLLKTKCSDFLNFLFFNCKREIEDPIQLTQEEMNLYDQKGINLYPAILFKKIKESTKYSEKIKEFLLFENLNYTLALYGITTIIDSINKILKQTYPYSEHLANMVDRFQKMNHLTPCNPAPDFQGTTPEGKAYSLSDFKGKVIFIDVWATWCGPCKAALPHTQSLQESFKKNKHVIFLFLSVDKNENNWKKYLIQHQELNGIHLRVVDKSFDEDYKITGIPRYIIVDRNGNIANAFSGSPLDGKIKEIIEKELLK